MVRGSSEKTFAGPTDGSDQDQSDNSQPTLDLSGEGRPAQDPNVTTMEFSERYQVVRVHGTGGQARVLLARDQRMGREVALKELATGGPADPQASNNTQLSMRRFLREARVTSQLEHPNIIPVYELGRKDDGTLFYTMRFVRGQNLAVQLSGCRTLADRLKLLGPFWDVCNAMAFAHVRGVVHRDLKPENIMLGEFGETVVLDWGIAKVKGESDLRADDLVKGMEALGPDADSAKTAAGFAVGTPAYMSPEQARGKIDQIDERSDVWGLGVILYEILTGQKPFWAPSPFLTCQMVVKVPPRPVLELCPEAPPELAAVAEKALRKEPRQRYQSAKELAVEVNAFMTGGLVRAYRYRARDLLRRFAGQHKAALLAVASVLVIVVVALVLVSIAYRREARALEDEHWQQLDAHFHLAQAFQKQAERLAEDKKSLSARIYAAAALRDNPANPGGAVPDAGFSGRRPESARLLVESLSLFYRSGFRNINGLARALPMDEVVARVAVSPDGKLLAGVDHAGWLVLWNLAEWREIGRVRAHAQRAFGLAFSPDSKALATSGADNTVKIWASATLKPVLSVDTPGRTVAALAFSPDGRRLVCGFLQMQVEIWDALTGRVISSLEPHQAQISSIAISPDGQFLATGSWDKTARLWEAASGKVLARLPHLASVETVAFSPDGKALVTGGGDGILRSWEAPSGQLLWAVAGQNGMINAIAFSPDGRWLAATGHGRNLQLWRADSGEKVQELEGHQDTVNTLTFTPDGKLLATAGYDRNLLLWQANGGDGLIRLPHGDKVRGVAFTRDGRWLATGSWDKSVRLWDAANGALQRTFPGHTDGVKTVGISPDGKLLASGGFDHTVRLWNLETGEFIRVITGHQQAVNSLAFSPDGATLATSSRDRTVKLWEVQTGKELASFPSQGWVYTVAFSPDGQRLASASEDKLVRVFDVASRRLEKTLQGHSDWVSGVAFSPKDKTLASCGKDGVAILWDLESGQELRRFVGHQQWVNEVAFSPDGRMLVTGSDDGFARVWDVESGAPRMILRAKGEVVCNRFTPDGRRLVVSEVNDLVFYPLGDYSREVDPVRAMQEAEVLAGLELRGFDLTAGPKR